MCFEQSWTGPQNQLKCFEQTQTGDQNSTWCVLSKLEQAIWLRVFWTNSDMLQNSAWCVLICFSLSLSLSVCSGPTLSEASKPLICVKAERPPYRVITWQRNTPLRARTPHPGQGYLGEGSPHENEHTYITLFIRPSRFRRVRPKNVSFAARWREDTDLDDDDYSIKLLIAVFLLSCCSGSQQRIQHTI